MTLESGLSEWVVEQSGNRAGNECGCGLAHLSQLNLNLLVSPETSININTCKYHPGLILGHVQQLRSHPSL